MRIAFVSYEYAGVQRGGGIGAYMRNVAAMMAARGHEAEVFTATEAEMGPSTPGVIVHPIVADRADFAARALAPFAARHTAEPFDVVEGPEYGTDASEIAVAFPSAPLVVKLHTPSFVISELNHAYLPLRSKARFMLGGLRRGRIPRRYWVYEPKPDVERAHALAAAEITAPSRAILKLVADRWGLPSDRISHIPYPYVPAPALLEAPVGTETGRITFVGRLELRKGVLELAAAIPRVLDTEPGARFRVVGRSSPDPITGEDMQARMRRIMGGAQDAVEFVGAVNASEVPAYLSDTDICVFPSVWENYPYVCMEAMAAGRGVIASTSGGMAEMVEDGRTGRLVPPRDVGALAQAIVQMLRDPARRMAMGRAARDQVQRAHAPDVIGPMQEASYRRAIARTRAERGVLVAS